jgi:hypothetical protein
MGTSNVAHLEEKNSRTTKVIKPFANLVVGLKYLQNASFLKRSHSHNKLVNYIRSTCLQPNIYVITYFRAI